MAELTTVTRPTWAVPAIAAKVAELNDRIAAKGLGEPVSFDVSEVRYPSDAAVAAYYGALPLVPVNAPTPPPPEPTVDITISTTPVALSGDWELVGVVDFSAADTPLVFELVEGLGLRDGVLDARRCDACGVARARNRTYAVRSADGAVKVVGSTCVSDFLGIDPARVLWFAEAVGEVSDEDEFFGGSFGSYDIPTVDFVAAARAAVVTVGWAKAASDWPTKRFAAAILSGERPIDNDDPLIEARERFIDPEVRAFAEAAVEWAAAIEPRSDFDHNLQAVASSETIGERGYGIAAYLPVAYARELDKLAAKIAEAAKVEAGEIEPVPTGRVTIAGEVIGISERYSDYGVTIKLTVRDDRGFRVWVTCPRAIDSVELPDGGWRELARGDRVAFDATVEPSSDDEFFGFGKRPTKARVLEVAA
jgi:hypothetical protein